MTSDFVVMKSPIVYPLKIMENLTWVAVGKFQALLFSA